MSLKYEKTKEIRKNKTYLYGPVIGSSNQTVLAADSDQCRLRNPPRMGNNFFNQLTLDKKETEFEKTTQK
jgi:hypothetical protein